MFWRLSKLTETRARWLIRAKDSRLAANLLSRGVHLPMVLGDIDCPLSVCAAVVHFPSKFTGTFLVLVSAM